MNHYRHHIRLTAEQAANRLQHVGASIYRHRIPLAMEVGAGDTYEAVANWRPIHAGELWGGQGQWRYFRTTVDIPAEWAGQRVGLDIALSHRTWRAQSEALVYINGKFEQGIDGNHHEVVLTSHANGGEHYTIVLRAWCTLFDEDTAAIYEQLYTRGDLVCIDLPTRQLYHSVEVALDSLKWVNHNQPEYHVIMNGLEACFLALDLRQPASEVFYASVPHAQTALDSHIGQLEGLPVTVWATGHAHIDVLWRWTLFNTREKTQHSFGTVVKLMEQYPHYHFTQSQPQLYYLLKQDDPALYEQIRNLVKAGRWEPTGGMWVEVDCNIPNGESLVRQLLYGTRFYEAEFGTHTPVLWLPDTFGYSWALPQIVKRSGLKYFMTSKISWNQYNRLPYDSFRWRGIDGTELLTHFLTAPGDPQFGGSTYNAMLLPHDVLGAWTSYQQKDRHQELLTAFGWGDGGGGPTLEMLERAERMANHPGLPKVKQASAGEFFDRLAEVAPQLPAWNGELYLEFHRGTYTSQAYNKRANRQSELLYHRAELAAAIATLHGHRYPHEALDKGWRLILLNQFHDVIPGSSVREVYVDSAADYERAAALGHQVLRDAVDQLQPRLPLAAGEEGLLVFHTAGLPHAQPIISFPSAWLPSGQQPVTADGQNIPYQRTAERVYLHLPVTFRGVDWLLVKFTPESAPAVATSAGHTLQATTKLLENDLIRAEFNALGEITRLFDKRVQREVLAPSTVGNQLQAFEDRPAKWDAWDIDLSVVDKQWLAEDGDVRVVDSGPLCATLEVRKQIVGCPVIQRISLSVDSTRLDFHTVIDWRARHTLLKVAFPVSILATNATFDIQFGNVERPTHHNTSWDWARFETVGHKWANLGEGGYSVSLLNDCKYGYDVRDNVLRLSLLRAPTFPDPEADQGQQEFTYSLLVSDGDWRQQTVPQAYDLNNPALVFPVTGSGTNAALPASFTLFAVDGTGPASCPIVIETVKEAEDGRGLIVRLYETYRSRGQFKLACGFQVAEAWETNLMEKDEQCLPIENAAGKTTLTLDFTPYQIRTIRLLPV